MKPQCCCCFVFSTLKIKMLSGHAQRTGDFCLTRCQATWKTTTLLSRAYRSVSRGGVCEMFYSFSTTHCKTRSYKGMETINTGGVGS